MVKILNLIKTVKQQVNRKISMLACKHSYEKIGWYEGYDPVRNLRYSTRIYRCKKCGKRIEVDGRYDTICA